MAAASMLGETTCVADLEAERHACRMLAGSLCLMPLPQGLLYESAYYTLTCPRALRLSGTLAPRRYPRPIC
eukprot:6208931-Pyramimonas_sp.AAC.1